MLTCENFAQSIKNPLLQAGKMVENSVVAILETTGNDRKDLFYK